MTNWAMNSEMLFAMGIAITTSVCLSYMWCSRAMGKLKKQQYDQIKKMEATLSVLTSGSLGMGQKMLVLEEKLSRLRDTQDEMKQSDMDFSYTQAQKLISQGVDNHAVAVNSGLSATEINLMRLLHNHESSRGYEHA